MAVEESAEKRKRGPSKLNKAREERHILTGRTIRKKDGRENRDQVTHEARCKRQSQRSKRTAANQSRYSTTAQFFFWICVFFFAQEPKRNAGQSYTAIETKCADKGFESNAVFRYNKHTSEGKEEKPIQASFKNSACAKQRRKGRGQERERKERDVQGKEKDKQASLSILLSILDSRQARTLDGFRLQVAASSFESVTIHEPSM